MFPEAAREVRRLVTYADSPATPRHRRVLVRRRAGGGRRLRARRRITSFIGFEVAKPLLERALPRRPTALEMKDVFLQRGSRDRHLPPRHQRDDSRDHAHRLARQARGDRAADARRRPREASSSTCSRRDYERDFGTRLPEARPVGAVPRVSLQAAAENRAAASRCSSRRRRRRPKRCSSRASRTRASGTARTLDAVASGRLDLANTDFDTGKPSAHGEYALADETYAELLHRLAERHFAGVPRAAEEHRGVLRRGAGQGVWQKRVEADEESPRATRGAEERGTLTPVTRQLSSLKSPGH